MQEWLKTLSGTNLAVLFLGLTLLICAFGLFVNHTAGLALEAIKILGSGMLGFVSGKAVASTNP